MVSSSNASDLPQNQESLQIKQDGKFFSRLLSKESSMANPSLRVYYGLASVAVPFLWESQPGTPKNSIPTTTLPPLTPPPSYLSHTTKKHLKKKKPTKHFSLITTILLPRLTALRKASRRLSSSSVSSSSEYSSNRWPTSTLCFGLWHGSAGGFRGCN